MVRFMLLACAALFLVESDAHAGLIAYWNFNSYDGSATIIPSSLGTGSITISGFPDADLDNLAGTTVNALGGDPAGASLTLNNNVNNGDFLTLSFSMSGLKDLVLTYATRRTSTGFSSDQWSYSNDGLTFTSFGTPVNPTTSTTFALVTRDFTPISSLNGDGTVFLRYTLNGATSSSGSMRIDNMQLNASPAPAVVPEPSSMLLMAVGILGLMCRRKALGIVGG